MGTIAKALELLNLFSRSRPEIGLGELARLVGRDKATLHRHLAELLDAGLLERNAETRAYRLGPAVLRLAAVRETTAPLRSALMPVAEHLADLTGELAHVSVLQGDRLSPVCHADPGRHGTQVHFDEAELLPLHATSSGLAALAFSDRALEAKVIDAGLPPHAAGALTDPDALRAALETVRTRGWSRLDRGFDDEVVSQGAPVFGPQGRAMGALSVAVPVVRVTDEKMRAMLPALLGGARRAARAVGGEVPETLERTWNAAIAAAASDAKRQSEDA